MPRQSITLAGAHAAAIDHVIGVVVGGVVAEGDARAETADGAEQEACRRRRIDMAFLGVEQAGVKAPREIRLHFGQLVGRERAVALRQAREADQLAAVAGMGHDQRAVADDARERRAPDVERPEAEILHDVRRRLALAEGRQHGAGEGACRLAERIFRAVDQVHRVAAVGERVGLPQACDAGADDRDRG